MNTLTVSIGLLVAATLIAVVLHGLWQSYRQRSAPQTRLAEPSPADESMGRAEASSPADFRFDASDLNEPAADPVAAMAAKTGEPGLAASPDAPLHPDARAEAGGGADPDGGRSPVSAGPVAVRHTGQDAADRLEPTLSSDPVIIDSALGQGAGLPVAGAQAGAAGFAIETDADAGDAQGGGNGAERPSPRVEPAVADRVADIAPARVAASQSTGPVAAGTGLLSARTDCIVELALPSPMPGQKLLQTVQTIRRFGSKPVLFEGLLAPEVRPAPTGEPGEPVLLLNDGGAVSAADPQQDNWVPLRADLFFRSLRMGVLLANRHGALNAMEFADFAETASRLAEHLGALVLIPDMTRTLEAARALDVECIKLDAQLGLNVDSLSALSAAHLSRLGRDLGLVERGSNRFVRLGRNDAVLFSMAQADRPNRLTLLLDVPRAPVDQQPWSALLQCAHDAMTAIQGHLVDDSGRPLNSRNLDTLSAELAKRYAMLDQSGLKAGSPLALRVFN